MYILELFLSYGIDLDNVSWVIYKKDIVDSVIKKVSDVDIIFLLGGVLEKFYNCFVEYNLLDIIKNFNKVVMGLFVGIMV